MITDIRLQNFRSYKDTAFELDKGVNIVVGPNASGKTNLLESIMIICRGRSFKSSLGETVQTGKDWCSLEAHVANGSRKIKLKKTKDERFDKEFVLDGKSYRILPTAKVLPTVLFEPNHLLILSGRPDLRRDYLDDILEQTTGGYGRLRNDYKRALYQRNTLLKKGGQQAKQQIFAWDIRLSQLGEQIAKLRNDLVEKINSQIEELYQHLSKSKASCQAVYSTALNIGNYGTVFLKKLEQDLDKDLARGFTGQGPHREDLTIYLNDQKAQDTASRGEIRTLLLALKIIELHILEELKNQKPLILLDDVFSELDGARRQALTDYLRDYQTFITTTDADLVVHNFAQKCHIVSTQH